MLCPGTIKFEAFWVDACPERIGLKIAIIKKATSWYFIFRTGWLTPILLNSERHFPRLITVDREMATLHLHL